MDAYPSSSLVGVVEIESFNLGVTNLALSCSVWMQTFVFRFSSVGISSIGWISLLHYFVVRLLQFIWIMVARWSDNSPLAQYWFLQVGPWVFNFYCSFWMIFLLGVVCVS